MTRRRRKGRDRFLRIARFASLGMSGLSPVLDQIDAGHYKVFVLPGGILLACVLWGLQEWIRFVEAPRQVPLTEPMPQPGDLIGRRRTVDRVVDRAQALGVVVVYGPAGTGGSSVAISAARRLVPDETRQRYVDLSRLRSDRLDIPLLRDRNRWLSMPVLRTLGLDISTSGADAVQAIAETLRGSGLVLVIDNAADVNEVRWIAEGVPGAFIIVSGDIETDELAGVPCVPVQGLKADDSLKLLRLQDAAPPQGLARVLRVIQGARPNSIAARINAEPEAARELALHYLRHPRVAILLGGWLAENPDERLSDLLRTLRAGEEVYGLQLIMRRVLEGASNGSRRLLAVLCDVPDVEYPDEAVAAMARISLEDADRQLTELGRRFLVHRTSSRSRVTRQAANLAEKIPDRKAAAVYRRLSAYYGRLAAENAALLTGDGYADGARWLAAQDVTLLALLGMASPPKRAAKHLWGIANALDAWFAREGRHHERSEAAQVMLVRATDTGDVTAQAIALIRMAAAARGLGDLAEAERRLNRAEALGHGRTPWSSQLKTEWALHHAATGDADAAYDDIERSRRGRPQRDTEGRLIDLINLATLEIDARLCQQAVDHLADAIRLAADDVAGRAYALEVSGHALTGQGHVEAATDAWNEAEELYASIGDKIGQGRCVWHRTIRADVQR